MIVPDELDRPLFALQDHPPRFTPSLALYFLSLKPLSLRMSLLGLGGKGFMIHFFRVDT